MTIAKILESKGYAVATVPAGATIRDTVAVLGEKRIGAAPVLQDGQVAGIVSERDIIYALRTDGPAILDWAVDTVMTAPVITVDTRTPILSALSLMSQKRIRHLPVVEDGRILGIVSIGDLVKHRMDQMEQEAAAMLTYIQTA